MGTGKWPALPPPPGGFLPTLTPKRGGGVGTVPGRAPPPAGRPGSTFRLPLPGEAGYPSIQPDPPETDHPLPYSAHSVTAKTTPPPEMSRPEVHSFHFVYSLKSRCLWRLFSFPISCFHTGNSRKVLGHPTARPPRGWVMLSWGGPGEGREGWAVPAWGLHSQTSGGTDVI